LKYPYDTPVGTINAGILARETTVQESPDLIRAFVGAHRDAVARLRGNLDEAAELANKNWGFPLKTSRKALENVDLRWVIDDAFMSDLTNYMDRMKELGLIASVPDINKLVVRDFARP
jgi:NitT/TauT family transport system substrate-binding protein